MDAEKLQTGFVRNRRFLIAVSFALAAFYVLGLKFSQVTLLGNTAVLSHPERVEGLGWAIWLWAVLQYVVWFRDIGALREFWQALTSDCEGYVGAKKLREYEISDYAKGQLTTAWQNQPNIAGGILAAALYSKKFARVCGDGKQIPRWADIEITAHIRMPNDQGSAQSPLIRIEQQISKNEWRRSYARAVVSVFLTRRFTYEYFAPFLIAALPIYFWHLTRAPWSPAVGWF